MKEIVAFSDSRHNPVRPVAAPPSSRRSRRPWRAGPAMLFRRDALRLPPSVSDRPDKPPESEQGPSLSFFQSAVLSTANTSRFEQKLWFIRIGHSARHRLRRQPDYRILIECKSEPARHAHAGDDTDNNGDARDMAPANDE